MTSTKTTRTRTTKRALVLFLLLPLSLAACGAEITGVVTEKLHDPEDRDSKQVPVYRSDCTGSGTSKKCTKHISHYETKTTVDDEDWSLVVKTKDGKFHTREVTREAYAGYDVGDVYDETTD